MNKLKPIIKPFKRLFSWFKKTRMRNKIIIIVLMLIAAYFISGRIRNANKPPEYLTQKVEVNTIEQIVSETGNVNSSGIVDVYSNSTGMIEEIYVEDGDEVKENQNLFKVHSTATQQEKATAYASYQNAVSAEKTAEQNKQA
jgi:multidrug efflux pump subunit AcrA (membrane-fusion protein)